MTIQQETIRERFLVGLSQAHRIELEAVARKHGLSLKALRSARRPARFVEARLECYRLLREAGWSTTRIGMLFRRDHSTIVHALNGGVGAKRKAKLERAA